MLFCMTGADEVWNRAALAWDPTRRAGLRRGDQALAALLRFHGLPMNGGVLDTLENADDHMLREAIGGYHYYGLGQVAALIEDAVPRARRVGLFEQAAADELEMELDRVYLEHIPSDGTLVEVFEKDFTARPDEYSPLA